MTSNMPGEEGREVLVFPVFPLARYLDIFNLVTFHTWPIIPIPRMPNCLPQCHRTAMAVNRIIHMKNLAQYMIHNFHSIT